MEKISNIVRGNARTASVDLKSSGSVRPGALAFGRPMGESPQSPDRTETTAMRVTNIQNELNEAKKTRGQDHTVEQMADQFFMTRIRRPEEEIAVPKVKVSAKEADTEVEDELHAGENTEAETAQPSGFTPRGSFVNVLA